MEEKLSKTQMTEAERLELCQKLDKELDDYIDSLEKRSYTEGWPEDRWEEEMEKHPFFMTKTPTDGEQISPLMQGLQNLKYDAEENTPEELASNYKEDGNFNFKYKNYRLAILSYTEGLKAKCGNAVLNAQLLNNRSASQFMLGNYRSSLKDAEACLRLDPSHSKARARAIQCCMKMRNYDDCLKHCDSYLAYDPTDTKMQQIRTETISLKKRADRDSRLEARKMKAKTAASEALMKALRDRAVTLLQEEDEEPQLESLHPAADGAKVTLGEDGRLSWPCVILYPEYGISDFVQQWHEDITFYSQMSEIFSESPEWDDERKYVPDSLSIFFEGDEDSRRIHRIDPTSTLGEVLSDKSDKNSLRRMEKKRKSDSSRTDLSSTRIKRKQASVGKLLENPKVLEEGVQEILSELTKAEIESSLDESGALDSEMEESSVMEDMDEDDILVLAEKQIGDGEDCTNCSHLTSPNLLSQPSTSKDMAYSSFEWSEKSPQMPKFLSKGHLG